MTDKNDMIDFFNDQIEGQGIAVSSVADGHVFGFTRDHLQKMLDQNPDKQKFIVFVKNREFKN